jgi:hypothetical protein
MILETGSVVTGPLGGGVKMELSVLHPSMKKWLPVSSSHHEYALFSCKNTGVESSCCVGPVHAGQAC